jgi:putative PIN family toxin of toxin-antitoxin system
VRLVIDTNILISALLAGTSLPAHLIVLWREGRFDLLTSADQLDELIRVTRYPKIRERLVPALAGRLINELREIAVMLVDLPTVTVCADPLRQLPAGNDRRRRRRLSCNRRQARLAGPEAL